MVWNPEQTADLAGFDPLLHQALRTSALRPEAPAPSMLPQTTVPQSTLAQSMVAQTLLAEMVALPGDVSEADLQAHLAALAAHVDAFQIRDALEPAAGGQITRAGAKAMIVHATDPAVAERLSGSGYPARAFTLAGLDDDLLTLFATRAARVLERAYPKQELLQQRRYFFSQSAWHWHGIQHALE